MSVTVDRVRLHQLVDALRERDLDTVHHMLRGLLALDGDPVLNAFVSAPEDDEPVTPEEEAAVQRARADIDAGRVHSHEEAKRILRI